MSRLELLNSRGFKDEKHLSEFLKNCADETWKKELMDFFGEAEEKPKKSDKKSSEKKKVKETEVDETPVEEIVTDEIVTE